MGSLGALLSDRRNLLDYVLKVGQPVPVPAMKSPPAAVMYPPIQSPIESQDISRQGGRVVCPPGACGSEPWLLDSLDVKQLIKAMQAGVCTCGCGCVKV